MRTLTLIIGIVLFIAACKGPDKTPVSKDKAEHPTSIKDNSMQFSTTFVKDLYYKSDLVAKIQVINAVKSQEIYIVNAKLIEAYKGKSINNSNLKYEAFLEEGNYKEFYGKELIIFLTVNKQDHKLFNEGVRWGRTEPNVEFAYTDSLRSYILKLK